MKFAIASDLLYILLGFELPILVLLLAVCYDELAAAPVILL